MVSVVMVPCVCVGGRPPVPGKTSLCWFISGRFPGPILKNIRGNNILRKKINVFVSETFMTTYTIKLTLHLFARNDIDFSDWEPSS